MNVSTGTGKALFRTGVCGPEDIEQNMRMLQKLHDMLDNPIPSDDPDTPSTISGVRWAPFILTEDMGATTPSQATANVLGSDGSAFSPNQPTVVYDPLGLWSTAASGQRGTGYLIKSPVDGSEVIFIPSPFGVGGGGGVDSYTVKIDASDSDGFLASKFKNDGGGALGANDQAVIFGDDGSQMYAYTGVTNNLIKVNSLDPVAEYLEDKLVDDAGTVPAGAMRVYFGTLDDDTAIFAYTEDPLGDGFGSTVHDLVVSETGGIADGSSGDATLLTTSGCTPTEDDTITVCNLKTGRKLWDGAQVKAYRAPDGTYIAISSNAATLCIGTASGASNAGNAFASISLTSPDGLADFMPAATLTGVTNPLSLTIAASDKVVAAWDNSSAAWVAVSIKNTAGDSRRVIAKVNEGSGVTDGQASFTVDNVRPLSSGLNPVASTANGVDLIVKDAKQAYDDNAEVYAEWDNDYAEWIDVTDIDGTGASVVGHISRAVTYPIDAAERVTFSDLPSGTQTLLQSATDFTIGSSDVIIRCPKAVSLKYIVVDIDDDEDALGSNYEAGEGIDPRYLVPAPSGGDYDLDVWNAVFEEIGADKPLQSKAIGGTNFIDVEPCGP